MLDTVASACSRCEVITAAVVLGPEVWVGDLVQVIRGDSMQFSKDCHRESASSSGSAVSSSEEGRRKGGREGGREGLVQ